MYNEEMQNGFFCHILCRIYIHISLQPERSTILCSFTVIHVHVHVFGVALTPSLLPPPLPSFLIGCMQQELPVAILCKVLCSLQVDPPHPHFPLTSSPLWAPHHMVLGVLAHQQTLATMAVYQTCTTCLDLYLHLSVEE